MGQAKGNQRGGTKGEAEEGKEPKGHTAVPQTKFMDMHSLLM